MEENKVFEFNEANGNEGTQAEDIKVVVQKKGLRAKWNGLKLWQKALILAGGATLIYVGGKWIFKNLDKVEPEVQKVKVVVPMDSTNPVDNAVQDLVNTMAETEETPF